MATVTENKFQPLTDLDKIVHHLSQEIVKYFAPKNLQVPIIIGFTKEKNEHVWRFLYDVSIGKIKLPNMYKSYLDLFETVTYIRGKKDLESHPHYVGGYKINLPFSIYDIKAKNHILEGVQYKIFVNAISIVFKLHSRQFIEINDDSAHPPLLKKMMEKTKTNLGINVESFIN